MRKILKLNIFHLVEKIVRFLIDCGPQIRIALFTNMRILKFRSQPTIAFFAAVNHLNGPLRPFAAQLKIAFRRFLFVFKFKRFRMDRIDFGSIIILSASGMNETFFFSIKFTQQIEKDLLDFSYVERTDFFVARTDYFMERSDY